MRLVEESAHEMLVEKPCKTPTCPELAHWRHGPLAGYCRFCGRMAWERLHAA